MAICSNCGKTIPPEDKFKLCDSCKKILLPFVKLMDASTSSGVRRLISNERNLRNAGVTDSGMDYLYRICELHDQRKQAEREARLAASQNPQDSPEALPAEEAPYTEMELPPEEPLRLEKKPYGGALPAAEGVLILLALGLLAWFAVRWFLDGSPDPIPAACAAGCAAGAYVTDQVRRMYREFCEIKKRFW